MKRLAVLAVMALVLAACGGGETSDAADVTNPQPESIEPTGTSQPATADTSQGTENDGAGLPASDSNGVVTVDGQAFEAPIFRCEPNVSGQPHEADLSLVAFLSPTEGLNVDITNSMRTDMNTGTQYQGTHLSILYSTRGADGMVQYEGGASSDPDGGWFVDTGEFVENPDLLDGPPYELNGGKLAGALAVAQAFPEGGDGVVEVLFDLEIPSEVIDCSTR